MKSLYIISSQPYCGKTLICLGLGLYLKNKNLNVGYFKPIGTLPLEYENAIVDEDAMLISNVLDLKDGLQKICPLFLKEEMIEKNILGEKINYLEKIKKAYTEICKNKDVILLTGTDTFFEGKSLKISSIDIAEELNTSVLLVINFKSLCVLEEIFYLKNILKEKLLGVVINNVNIKKFDYFENIISKFCSQNNITLYGVVPKNEFLKYVSVEELNKYLNGKILCAEGKKEEAIKQFSIGAMTVENALKFFRKKADKAVITGGDRADIQLAALETSTKCLVLTGGLYPNAIILSKAEELGVPIIVVEGDTLNTIEKIETLTHQIRIKKQTKVQEAMETINKYVKLEKLFKVI